MRQKFVPVLLALALLIPLSVVGQANTVNVTWTWAAPTTGNAVQHYVVQFSSNGTTWATATTQPTGTSVTLACPIGVQVMIKVAGVDAVNQQGAYSDPADPFVPLGVPPGAPGKPVKT